MGQIASGNYFDVAGVTPALGRGFLPEEDQVLGRNPVVVLGYGLWQRRFGADRSIIGRQIPINGHQYTVVGVAPAGFSGIDRAIVSEFWVPLAMYREAFPDLGKEKIDEKRDAHWLIVNGRLKPGVKIETAVAAVNMVKRRIDAEYKKGNDYERKRTMTLEKAGGLIDELDKAAGGLMAFLMVIVGLVLMVACANVANLLLARAAARRKEIGVRLAIGAGRGRLVRQLLTESILLAGMGAIVASALTWFAASTLSSMQLPLPLPIVFNFTPDLRVFAFTTGLTILTGILFGLVPALRATKPDVLDSLKGESSGLHLRNFSLRNGLVVVQIALSCVLLAGAVLFLRSLQSASSVDLGFDSNNIALMAIDPKLHSYSPAKTKVLLAQLRERISGMPDVASMTFLDSIPLSLGGTNFDVETTGTNGVKRANSDVYTVGTHFFETLGIPLVRGCGFQSSDPAQSVVLNQLAAERLFGKEDPLGRMLKSNDKTYVVIGIARNTKSRTISEEPKPCLYAFLEPNPDRVMSLFGISILVKTRGSTAAIFPAVRNQIRTIDPTMAVFNSETMQEHVNKALLLPRVSAMLLRIFGTIGLSLAAIGLYGVMSYVVRSQTREIGIRMALGAGSGTVLRSMATRGLAVAGVGLVIGCGLALAAGRLAESLLVGVKGYDPFTFVVVPSMLLIVAAIAVLIPARRAARVDPIQALRYE